MRADLPVLFAYIAFALLVCAGLKVFALSKATKLTISPIEAGPGARLSRRPLHLVRGRAQTILMIVATIAGTCVFSQWAMSSWLVDDILGRAGAEIAITGRGVAITYSDLPHLPGRFPWAGLLLILFFGGGAYLFRQSAVFPFMAIHLGIVGLSFLADLLFDAPVAARDVVVQRALSTAFVLILASHAFFAAIARPGLRGAVVMFLSSAVSAAAFVLGAVALVLIGTATTETTLMVTTYLAIAYGVLLQHVAGVSLALSEGEA